MISAEDYKFLADEIGAARSDANKSVDHILEMQNALSASQVDEQNINKLALRNAIESVYALVLNKYVGPKPTMNSFVRRMQDHVERRIGIPVNDFLKDNNIQVPQDFADLSALVGYIINIENIT